MELRHELEIARIAGACDGPECRATEASIRVAQGGCVRYVEGFRAEFHAQAFGEAERLADHEVRILQAGSANRIARTGADHELRSASKSSRIEVFGDAAAGEVVRIANHVRTLHGVSE